MPKTTLLRKQVTPTGSIQPHGGVTAPEGFLVCDGTIVTIADYPKLFASIDFAWGYGNNDGLTFHLPDLRGKFLRGHDALAGNDPDAAGRIESNAGGNTGDNVGSAQGEDTKPHKQIIQGSNKNSYTYGFVGGPNGAFGGGTLGDPAYLQYTSTTSAS